MSFLIQKADSLETFRCKVSKLARLYAASGLRMAGYSVERAEYLAACNFIARQPYFR